MLQRYYARKEAQFDAMGNEQTTSPSRHTPADRGPLTGSK
jgi:hypothetical protein